MQKINISLGALIAIIIGVFFALNGGMNQPNVPFATSTSSTRTEAMTDAPILEGAPTSVQQTKIPARTTSAQETVQTPTPNVTLIVNGISYTAFAPVGSTVLDAMRIPSSTSDFTFTGKDYPSLGFFVESINGQKAESGYSWILYVNGKLSGTGASQTTLKTGDTVEWRYEKNY